MKIYSIHDKTAGYYQTPWFQPTSVHAVRLFRAEINRAAADNLLYTNAEDFDLVELGSWSSEQGELTLAKPSVIATGLSLKVDPKPTSTDL